MSLTPGKTVSHYRLVEKIGEGGMGVVWKADDTRLHRPVALKFLPEGFGADAERLARFEREARALASLNHPNIAAIHSIHERDGVHFLAMELVDGEDLAQRLARGPLPPDEALEVARQVAAAAEAAHDNGVVHRDLKPANIKVTPDGTVKVLDFGLAKALAPEPLSGSGSASLSPTITSLGTVAGVILGTAAYMSPEQARGRAVDRRTDVWAFGCVLYECLTGVSPFHGETVSDSIGAILHKEPDYEKLPPGRPALRRLIERCLRKKVHDRLQHLGDARIEIDEILSGDVEAAAAPVAARTRRSAPSVGWAAIGLVAGLLLGWVGLRDRAPSAALPDIRFDFVHDVPDASVRSLVVSPDGRKIIYDLEDTTTPLYLRELNDPKIRTLAGSDGASNPFFSPDSRWIGFASAGKLQKLSLEGGVAVKICDTGSSPGATWMPDDTIVFSPTWTDVLYRVSADGGEPAPISTLHDGEVGHWWARPLPGDKRVLFTISIGGSMSHAKIGELDLETGQHTVVGPGADARYLPGGGIVYHRAGIYEMADFDLEGLEIGSPRRVLDDVPPLNPTGSKESYYALSDRGLLAYIATTGGGQATAVTRLAWMDRAGRFEELPLPAARYTIVDLAPDGNSLLTAIVADGEYDIWLVDIQRGTRQRMTNESNNLHPVWHPDGNRFAFTGTRDGSYNIYQQDLATGDAASALLLDPADLQPYGWTPDGAGMVYQIWESGTGTDIGLLDTATGERTALVSGPFDERKPSLSPDGRWLAFHSVRGGIDQVYVAPFPGPGPAVQVSETGGTRPRWSRDGSRLLYLNDGRLMTASIRAAGSRVDVGKPTPFVQSASDDPSFRYLTEFAPALDGRVLVVQLQEQPEARIHVVVNGLEWLNGGGG